MTELETTIGRLVEELGHEVGAPDEPLELSSLEMVMLHDRIEDALSVRIPAREVTPERFGTVAALAQLVESSR